MQFDRFWALKLTLNRSQDQDSNFEGGEVIKWVHQRKSIKIKYLRKFEDILKKHKGMDKENIWDILMTKKDQKSFVSDLSSIICFVL